MTTKHPAKFSPELLPVMARYVDGARTILDPFAGTGRMERCRICHGNLIRAWRQKSEVA